MAKFDIDRVFTYHPPSGDQPQRYERIRAAARELAVVIEECSPNSREKSLAFTYLQQVVMFGNAAIAINETVPVPAYKNQAGQTICGAAEVPSPTPTLPVNEDVSQS